MTLVVKDRVKETTTTTGTGTINLAGAATGFQTFVAAIGTTNTTFYAVTDANGSAWEVGVGTVTDASPDTLARTTLIASSTGSKIVLTSGTHTVFATYPADKSVYLDASGGLSHAVDLTSEVTGILPTSNGGTGTAGGIALGTSTTGDYVKNLIAGSLITLPVTEENSGETATPTIAVSLAAAVTATPVDGDYMLFLDGGIGSCNDASYTTQATCEAAGSCSNGSYTTEDDCETATEIWTAKVWTAADGTPAKGSLASIADLFAGDGLTASQCILDVNVDDSTIETNSDVLRVKDDGITLDKMAGITRGSIIYGDASGDPAYFAVGSANTVFQTVDGVDVSWNTVATDMIADNAVTLAKMAGIVTGSIIYGDGSGNPAYLAVGATNTFLTGGSNVSWSGITIGMLSGLTRGSLITADDTAGSCNDDTYTDQAACEAAGSCTNGLYTEQATCEGAGETWTAKIWTATLTELTIGAADTVLTSDGTDPSWTKVSNVMLVNDSVSYGGIEVDLGASDDTPAFNLVDATGLPIIDGTTGTLSVARGGTGQTTLDNLITLGGHTTGSYVSTLTGGTGITSTGATTGETIAHSISTDASQTHVTGLGTITTGVWQATTIAVGYGGTGATTLDDLITLGTHTTGDYAATITAGVGLTSTGATSGESIAHSLSVDASQTQVTALGTIGTGVWEATKVAVAYGGTNATSFANKAVVITQDTGDDTLAAAAMTSSGGLLIGGASGPAVATLTAGDNITITNDDGAITIASEPAAEEAIQDIVGTMLTAGTSTRVAVTYQDGANAMDFVVDDDLDNYDNTVTQFIKQSEVAVIEDIAGPMMSTGGTKTGVALTYQAATNTMDIVVADTTFTGDTGSVAKTPGTALAIAGGTNVTTAVSGSTLTITVPDTRENIQTIDKTSSATNLVTDVLVLKSQSSGTPAAGIGTGVSFETHTAAGNVETGARIASVVTDATATAEDIDMVIYTMVAGATATESLRIKANGDMAVAGKIETTAEIRGSLPADAVHTTGTCSVTTGTAKDSKAQCEDAGGTWTSAGLTAGASSCTASCATCADSKEQCEDGGGTWTRGSFAVDVKTNGGVVLSGGQVALDLGASAVTGAVGVTNGGTGVTSLTNFIDTGKIADDAVTAGKIADDAVGAAAIADDAVGAAAIADDAVGAAAIADDAVGTAAIADNAVGMGQMAGIARGGCVVGDLNGDPSVLSPGDEDQVLCMNASGDVDWCDAAAGGEVHHDHYTASTGMVLSGDAFSTSATQAHVTSLGTIGTGVWAATDVAIAHGGTGASTLDNLITLGDHTTGDYVSTLTGGVGITSTGATGGETIVHSISTDASQTHVTGLGTITAGVWNATKIAGAYIADAAIDSQHYVAGSIDTAHIAADQIVGSLIADAAVDSEHIAAAAIDTAHIGDLQVTTAKIAADAIDGTKLADNAVDSEHYTDASIDTAHIGLDQITSALIADDQIDSEHYVNLSIDTAHIGNLQITTGKIAADAVDGTKIADNAVDSEHYTDASIDTAHIGLDQITSALIADDQIDSEHYIDGSIDTAHIGDLQVTTGKIADDAIDGTKLADNAVDSEHYTDGSIDLIHLSVDSVDGTKIVDDAIDSEHYTDASIDFVHIQDIAANSILGRNAGDAGVLSEIALTTTQLLIGNGTGFTAAALSGDVTMTNAGVVAIGDDKIDSQHYVDGSIDTAHIADDQVTLAKMAGLARGSIIIGNASGDPTALSIGSDNYVLTSDGTDIAWEAAASGGGGTPTVITVADESTDTTCFPLFVTAATGDLGPKSGSNLTFNSSTGILTTTGLVIADGGNIGSASDTDAMAISSGGNVTFSKATKPSLKANSDASTVTFDVNEANVHTVTLGGNRTFAISNETAGQKFMIRVLQDGTGSRTLTWFSTIKWAGGSAPTLTTTAGKADVFGFLVTGTDTYDGFVVGQNI